MSTLLVYSPAERERSQLFGAKLERAGRTILFAPLGLPVMSPDWKKIVAQNIDEADSCILLLSKSTVTDASVLFRISLLVDRGKVVFSLCFAPFNMTDIPSQSKELQFFLISHQYGIIDDHYGMDQWAEQLHHMLPRERPRCFLSYSSRDVDMAKDICFRLATHKLEVWRDQESIKAGTEWDRQIEGAIRRSTHFLILHTANSANSDNVRDEFSFARELGKVIIPLLFDDTKLPLRIHRAQAIDMRVSIDDGVRALVAQLDSVG